MSAYRYPSGYRRKINWPLIILIIFLAAIFAAVFIFLIWKPISSFSSGANSLLNESKSQENQGIAPGEPNPNGYDCTKDVYNCENFTTQSEAQVAFDSCFKDHGDIWQLDKDGDGIVCESLA